ncbi:MAG TPA: anti-sigma regulatory factor [Gemmatimonadaceae bacterium]|nr:anti-sigma regulatory factor [Gemmatimonadaceae bacterium]
MATVRKREIVQLRADGDVVRARHAARALCAELRFSLVDQTKIVTATSELARNTIVYGHGGTATIEFIEEGSRLGVRLTFEDQGPGIPDVERAMQDGYSTGTGMGLGLGGSRRLVHDFDITSTPESGTRVVAVRWR